MVNEYQISNFLYGVLQGSENATEIEENFRALGLQVELSHLVNLYWKFEAHLASYGVADIIFYGVDRDSNLYIYPIELKSGNIGCEEMGQIARYVTAMEEFVKTACPEGVKTVTIRGIIIGNELKSGDASFIANATGWIDVYFYIWNPLAKEFKFEIKDGWHRPQENFLCRFYTDFKEQIQGDLL